jgi:hypothetical protein
VCAGLLPLDAVYAGARARFQSARSRSHKPTAATAARPPAARSVPPGGLRLVQETDVGGLRYAHVSVRGRAAARVLSPARERRMLRALTRRCALSAALPVRARTERSAAAAAPPPLLAHALAAPLQRLCAGRRRRGGPLRGLALRQVRAGAGARARCRGAASRQELVTRELAF